MRWRGDECGVRSVDFGGCARDFGRDSFILGTFIKKKKNARDEIMGDWGVGILK